MEESQVLSSLAALSQETRLRILRYLIKAGPSGAPAGDIGKAVSASSSRVSFHLTTLAHAGLVTSERASRNIIYKADFVTIGALMRYMLEDCCQNHPEILACCTPKRRR